jgi:Carbohydrate esterase, sialic acid-specific acetylesterase
VLSRAPFALLVLTLACGLQEHGGAQPGPPPPPPPTTMVGPDAAAPPPPSPGPPADAAAQSDRTPISSTPPPPPAQGPGVTIAGNFIPKSKAIVLLHIGHSNTGGRATTPPNLKSFFYDTDPHLWIYGKGSFRPALEPTAPDNQDGQAAGPGMALLRLALALAPDAMVISIGHGHSGSFSGYCSSFRKGGLFYDIVMAPARELKGKVTFGGIFTMFGQSEHNADAAQQARFSDCLKGMAQEMRTDLDEPDLPFMVGDYEAGITRSDIAPTSPFAKRIIAELQLVPEKVPRSALIPTMGLSMQDDHHFNMDGHMHWAERAITLLVQRGWAPWKTTP